MTKRIAFGQVSSEHQCDIKAIGTSSPQIGHILICASLICLLASGCASLPTTVRVPVATTCVPSTTPALPPTLAESELAALSDYALVLRIAAERLELLAYSKQAEIVISGCR
jgi:hypothetical protein